MNMKRSALRAGAVLAVAFAAGHLVQTLNAERGETATADAALPKKIEKVSAGPDTGPGTAVADPALPSAASLTGSTIAPALPDPVAPDPVPAELAALTEEPPAAPGLPQLPALPELAPPAAPAPAATPAPGLPEAAPIADCTAAIALSAAPRAMISVAISAPCAAGERVVLRHAGLAVAERLDDAGQLALDLPGLNDRGEVSALFADAAVLRDAVPLPEAATIRRFVVQWMAEDAFQLRAVEAGQGYGDTGNVSAGAPVSAAGGYLVVLGDPALDLPMMAQVYTWPADPAVPARPVVEAAVTEATCGRELLGETILAEGGATTVKDLTVAMPDCAALGDILVLNNLVGDVTLAAEN